MSVVASPTPAPTPGPAGVAFNPTAPSYDPLPTQKSRTIHSFLDSLPQQLLTRIFSSPSSCLAVFRLLPAVARQLVMAMLWCEEGQGFTREDVEIWVKRGETSRRYLENALTKLFRLHILHETETTLQLDDGFRESFKNALTGGGDTPSFGVVSAVGKEESGIDVSFLDEYATQRWETMLHFMVGSNLTEKPSKSVLQLLERSGLMIKDGKGMKITSRGFQFLLEEVHTQLWDVLLRYLSMAEERKMDLVEVLSFLFMLGSLELGKAYSTESLSRTQLTMLEDLRDYGLVYQSQKRASTFFPTRLATTLTSSATPLVSKMGTSEEDENNFLIIETNYRVYAYTSNPLQISILGLFLNLKLRFENLVVGMITRDSIKAALANGITAEQITTYLTVHAHPQMRKQAPLLPPTVVDQIRLWELEKNRVRSEECYLYDDFHSTADFELVLSYARQLEVVVWESKQQRKLCVNEDGHGPLRDFIKRRMGKS